MKRLLAAVLALCLLCPVVRAEGTSYVALTFDDGPSGRFTRALLEGLQQREVQATFLLCGYRMEQYSELTQEIFDQGHEIGLHGYSHKCMACMTAGELRKELSDTRKLLPQGCAPAFLRPPGGMVSDAVEAVAKKEGLALLSWSVDPRDWATHDPGSIEDAVLKNVEDGDIILLHDMSDSSVEAALYIVDVLQERGFVFLTASQLAARRGITPEPGIEYCRFSPESPTVGEGSIPPGRKRFEFAERPMRNGTHCRWEGCPPPLQKNSVQIVSPLG